MLFECSGTYIKDIVKHYMYVLMVMYSTIHMSCTLCCMCCKCCVVLEIKVHACTYAYAYNLHIHMCYIHTGSVDNT